MGFLYQKETWLWIRNREGDFPGGAVVKNPPANAGDMGSIPGPRRSHCRRAAKPVHHNYWAYALEPVRHDYWTLMLQLLNPCAATTEAHTL